MYAILVRAPRVLVIYLRWLSHPLLQEDVEGEDGEDEAEDNDGDFDDKDESEDDEDEDSDDQDESEDDEDEDQGKHGHGYAQFDEYPRSVRAFYLWLRNHWLKV